MRATAIFFLALVIRAAMVDSLTRKARAISAVVSPHSSRRVSATWASWASAGWQQVNTSRSRSSGITLASSASTASSPAAAARSVPTSSGSFARSVRSRRRRSRARRRAAVVSQAPGFSGTPRSDQVASAATKASCTHSSAMSRSPAMRTVAASTNAHSRRCASARTWLTSVTAWRSPRLLRLCPRLGRVHHRPDLDPAGGSRALLGERDGLVQVGRLDDVEAAQGLLGLHERPVGDGGVARLPAADRGGRGRRLKGLAGEDLAALLHDTLCERPVLLHHLVPVRGARVLEVGLVSIDEQEILCYLGLLGRRCGSNTYPTNGPPLNRQPEPAASEIFFARPSILWQGRVDGRVRPPARSPQPVASTLAARGLQSAARGKAALTVSSPSTRPRISPMWL